MLQVDVCVVGLIEVPHISFRVGLSSRWILEAIFLAHICAQERASRADIYNKQVATSTRLICTFACLCSVRQRSSGGSIAADPRGQHCRQQSPEPRRGLTGATSA